MLAYAFRVLRSNGWADLSSEEFQSATDLYAAILSRGINMQVRRGLAHAYANVDEVTPSPRGKVDVGATVKGATLARRRVACSHDEFTLNAYFNRVVKTCGAMMLSQGLSRQWGRELKRSLSYLEDVRPVDLKSIQWRHRYDRATQTYRLLMGVCRLAIAGLLQSQREGAWRLEDFSDEQQMSTLYERFILEYYRREHADEVAAEASYIPWALDGGRPGMLPVMRTDVTLRGRGAASGKTLIIDAKYYSRTMQRHFGKASVHSGNLYQIFAYVKNEAERLSRIGKPNEVSGLLLYAKTDESVQPDGSWVMGGNRIGVATLNLDADFPQVARQLDVILARFFR